MGSSCNSFRLSNKYKEVRTFISNVVNPWTQNPQWKRWILKDYWWNSQEKSRIRLIAIIGQVQIFVDTLELSKD